MIQDLSKFLLPKNFRGKSIVYVQLWWLVSASLFRHSPQFAYRWRAFLLRCFGARVGVSTVIRPTCKVTYPWNVEIGDYVWLGDDVVLYSLGKIIIGPNTVISQRSYICAADHNYRSASFEIRKFTTLIGSEVWIASDVFLGPNIKIGDRAVIGSRSSVYCDMPQNMVCLGSPCRPTKPRVDI
jgi:putative colanic acid biosynthesis acetyltransferase WcaF